MAGVPGLTPQQRMGALQASAQPGDMVSGGNIYRHAERDTKKSALGAIGQALDKLGFGDDRRRSRLAAGFASQWYGLDEAGNPAFGETPGIVDETKALGALPSMVVKPYIDYFVGAMTGQDIDKDPDIKAIMEGVIPFYKTPEWASKASDRADKLHAAVREDMELSDPKGFAENAQESLGVMFGQLPIPGGTLKKGAEEGLSAAEQARKSLGKTAEWFTPTVDPSAVNYLSGAGMGGALGTLADSNDDGDIPLVLPRADQPGVYDVRPAYSDGSVGYSGSDEDQALLAAEQEETPHFRRTNYADGGKVGVDVDYTQFDPDYYAPKTNKCDGGFMKYNDGGMAEVRALGRKYAKGGKIAKAGGGKVANLSHLLDVRNKRYMGLNSDADAVARMRTNNKRVKRATGRDASDDYKFVSSDAPGFKGKSQHQLAMDTVKAVKGRYAEGGKVSALKAIKDAIAHLDNGDTVSALRTLSTSPGALNDPNIAAAVAKLRRPTTARAGRQVLDSAVEADTNARVLPTFAKGGKVSGVDKVAKKAKQLAQEAASDTPEMRVQYENQARRESKRASFKDTKR